MDDYEEPVADAAWFKKNLEHIKKFINEGGNIQQARELLFSAILVGYYDCMWGGMDRDVGHLLYRLSDFIGEEERRQMMIYPSEDGMIFDYDLFLWDSLEDWRKQWEKSHPIIPEFDFQKHLEAIQILRLPETTGRT